MKKFKLTFDHIGITSSILCLIHCLALPVIFAASSIVAESGHHDEHHTHDGFNWDYVFAVLAIIAVYFTARRNPHKYIRVFLYIGAVLFAAGVALHEFGNWYYMMHAGSVTLIATHTYNLIKHRRSCPIPHS